MKAKDALAKCRQAIKGHPRQAAAIAAAVIVVVVLICVLCLRGCDGNESVDEVPAGTASQASTGTPSKEPTAESGSAESEAAQSEVLDEGQSAGAAADQDAAENDLVDFGSQPAATAPGQTSDSAPIGDGNAGSSGGSESAPAAPGRKWVVDYAQVWVQDSAAWDESIPTYGYQEKSICNVCGTDITGNEVTHGKAHMMAGEGSGHHTEAVQVVTGSQTVYHEATGHYETVESGGHWE